MAPFGKRGLSAELTGGSTVGGFVGSIVIGKKAQASIPPAFGHGRLSSKCNTPEDLKRRTPVKTFSGSLVNEVKDNI